MRIDIDHMAASLAKVINGQPGQCGVFWIRETPVMYRAGTVSFERFMRSSAHRLIGVYSGKVTAASIADDLAEFM